MKMDQNNSVMQTLYLLVVLFLMAGCADLASYQSKVADHTASFLPHLDESLAGGMILGTEEGKTSLSFIEACERAALVDVSIVELLAGIEKAKIDVDSAASNIWPRLNLQLKTELSLGNSTRDDVVSTGGVHVQYDFIKALMAGDEQAVREAFVLKDIVTIKLSINKLAQKLYGQLTRVLLAQFKLKKRREILDFTQKGSQLAQIYGEQKRVASETVWRWQGNLDQQKVEQMRAEQELLIAKRAFNGLLGLPGATKIRISDEDELMGKTLILDPRLPSASQIWTQHGQARLVEINTIAAEANLKQAKISGWPKVTANFGLGSIPITTENETSDSVVSFSLQVPLIDMGDHRRKVAQAQINLDLVKTGLEKVAKVLWINADNAFLRLEEAKKHDQFIAAMYNKALTEQNAKKELYDEDYIDTLDVIPQRIQLIELEIKNREVTQMVQEAAIEYNLAIGNDFLPDFSSSLLNDLRAKQSFAPTE